MVDIPGSFVLRDDSAPRVVRQIGTVIDSGGIEFPVHVERAVPILASPALEGSHVFSVGPAGLYSVSVTGLSEFAWLLIFDAIAPPVDGAVTPLAAIQAGSLASVSISFGGACAAFGTGVVAVLSSTGPFQQTSGPTGFLSALVR